MLPRLAGVAEAVTMLIGDWAVPLPQRVSPGSEPQAVGPEILL